MIPVCILDLDTELDESVLPALCPSPALSRFMDTCLTDVLTWLRAKLLTRKKPKIYIVWSNIKLTQTPPIKDNLSKST